MISIRMVLVLLAVLGSSRLTADLEQELNAMFERYNTTAHLDSPDLYKGQKAGFFTGPGLTVRSRLTEAELLGLDMPRFDAGCGGIDIYTGGFSFIGGEEIVDALKTVASSATGYAFLLAMETVSPQIASQMKTLQGWVNEVNRGSINSCELATQMIDSVRGKKTAINQHMCRFAGNRQGRFADWLASRQACAEEKQRNAVSEEQRNDPLFAGVLGDNFNLAWEVIKEHPFLYRDELMAELFVTFTGTLIVCGQDSKENTSRVPGKLQDVEFITSLLNGGNVKYYKCSNNVNRKCLSMTEATIHLHPENSWSGRIQKALFRIQDCIRNDEELSRKDRELLFSTRLPLYKIVNVMSVYERGRCPINLYNVSQIVARDLLIQYLLEVIGLIRDAAFQLRSRQFFAGDISDYLNELDRLENHVIRHELKMVQDMDQEMAILHQVEQMQEKIAKTVELY